MTKPIALVTGATSGIGRLAVTLLAKERSNWTILASGRRSHDVAATAAAITHETAADNVEP